MVTDNMGATRLDQCSFESDSVSSLQRDKYFPLLEIIETDFECAGFCEDGKYYLFSDVRNGVPANGNCKHALVTSAKNNATPFAVVLIVIGAIGFIGMIMSFMICKIAERKWKPSGYQFEKWGTSKAE